MKLQTILTLTVVIGGVILTAGCGKKETSSATSPPAPIAGAPTTNGAAPTAADQTEGARIANDPSLSPDQKQAAYTSMYRKQSEQGAGAH